MNIRDAYVNAAISGIPFIKLKHPNDTVEVIAVDPLVCEDARDENIESLTIHGLLSCRWEVSRQPWKEDD